MRFADNNVLYLLTSYIISYALYLFVYIYARTREVVTFYYYSEQKEADVALKLERWTDASDRDSQRVPHGVACWRRGSIRITYKRVLFTHVLRPEYRVVVTGEYCSIKVYNAVRVAARCTATCGSDDGLIIVLLWSRKTRIHNNITTYFIEQRVLVLSYILILLYYSGWYYNEVYDLQWRTCIHDDRPLAGIASHVFSTLARVAATRSPQVIGFYF